MKKLLVTLALVSLSASGFAKPLVYDYKAVVKHPYLKEARVHNGDFKGKRVYVKYVKSSSLKGFLIVDVDGVTSRRINEASTAQCLDLGRKRAFLVVQNSGAEKKFRFPKCLPAILDVKFFDTKFLEEETSTDMAEGNLFVGGDLVAAVRPQLDEVGGGLKIGPKLPLPAAGKAGGVAYADYAWQSAYLFGELSGPSWKGMFPGFEQAWDQNLPEALRRGEKASSVGSYHDAWLLGSGFGKHTEVTKQTVADFGLGFSIGMHVPKSLSGDLSGAFYLCAKNGVDIDSVLSQAPTYSFFDQTEDEDYDWSRWDDLFTAKRLGKNADKTWALDAWQDDIWLDGAVDQTTTDVCSGTWSIKLNTKFAQSAYDDFIASMGGADSDKIKAIKEALNPQLAKGSAHPEVVKGGDELLYTILAVGYKLDKSANLADGTEIYSASAGKPPAQGPMLTPKFCTYYGLNNFK